MNLDIKIKRRKLPQDNHWDDRVKEIYHELVELDPALPEVIVQQEHFGQPGHVIYLSEISKDILPAAIDAFVTQIQQNEDYAWTPDVVFAIGETQQPEHLELLRQQYENYGVRGALLVVLTENPNEIDREKFIAGLESSQMEVLAACMHALKQLPPNEAVDETFALVKALRRLSNSDEEIVIRHHILDLVEQRTAQKFRETDVTLSADELTKIAQQYQTWLSEKYPEQAKSHIQLASAIAPDFLSTLDSIDWEQGDVTRGHKLFEMRACARCHGSRKALGPSLEGATRRFSPRDLFVAIADPNRDVSPRYQSTMIVTQEGQTHTGLIIYESIDGMLLRNSLSQTVRIEAEDIEIRKASKNSLMPAGLLKDLQPSDLADLYAYLKSLSPPTKTPTQTADTKQPE